MINIHLNGDIIRCPDIKRIQEQAKELRDIHRICKYNEHEDHCDAWQTEFKTNLACWSVNNNTLSNRCYLSGSNKCPGHKKHTDLGNQDKNFKIDNVNYRKISSSAHHLVKSSNHKTLFITLTFPKFKNIPNEKQINQCFSKFVENLRDKYDAGGYVAVRERGTINKRYHFHLLVSIPFHPFANINSAWCHAISDFCEFSKNAVTSDKKTLFINNPGRALRYVCKYFAKSKGQLSKSRLIFMSNNLIKKPIQFRGCTEQILCGYKGIRISQTSDYTTAFRITDPKEFDKFCNEFLYEFFGIPDKKSQLYSFHPG